METTTVPVAVVTGAAQGIGRKVAETLAGEGYALALTDLREPAETLEAASDARIELLLYSEGVSRNAYRCPSCGRVIDPDGQSPHNV